MNKLYKIKSILSIVFCLGSLLTFGQTTFNYTGSYQTYVVPNGVTSISIEVWGASGWAGNYAGGEGGYTYGEMSVTPGQSLYLYVGGQGIVSNTSYTPEGGGWNGGGDGQTNTSTNSVGGGGGATDVRTVMNVNPMDLTSLNSRVIVAGGGGGSTNNSGCIGGNGGGLVGQDGWQYSTYPQATGGTQSAGGSAGGAFGQGADATGAMTPWNGGGGGGYYGGGISTAHSSGAGGSSYDGGVTNSTMTQGSNVGDGYAIITELCTPVVITASAVEVCDGTEITLSASGNGTITWDNGVVDGVAFTPPLGTTVYSASSSDPGDCGNSIEILVTPGPSISLTASDEMFGNDGAAYLTIINGTAPFTFDWDYDGTGDDDDNNDLTGVPAGVYTVTMTDASGCSTTETITIGSQVGIEVLNQEVYLYPNPASDELNIALNGEFEYSMLDANGKIIYSGSGLDSKQLDLSNLESGMYVLQFITEGKVITAKVTKK